MKKKFKFVTLATMLIVAAGIVTFVACNKKNELLKTESQIDLRGNVVGIVYQEEVPDREAYIIDFKKKLQSAHNSEEVITVNNANSFMFDLLNFDFCNINNGRSDKCETYKYTLNVSNGVIGISEFAKLYLAISSNISNGSYYCILPKIDDFDANASVTTVSVKTVLANDCLLRDNVDPCDNFTANNYRWDDAADTLTIYLNMFNISCASEGQNKCYFTNYRNHMFYYDDPYYNTHPNAPRPYYCWNCSFNTLISQNAICELFWDYRDLASEFVQADCIISYDVIPVDGALNNPDIPEPIQHTIMLEYATLICSGSGQR